MNTQIISRWHRISAIVLTIFILLHLINHLVAAAGIEAHTAMIQFLRKGYRSFPGEIILFLAIFTQIITGILKVRRMRNAPKSLYDRIQINSGLYLAFFMIAHSSAIMGARHIFELETGFHFAAAPLITGFYPLFFIPYYTLAVVAFFAHLGSVFRWIMMEKAGETTANRMVPGFSAVGFIIAVAILYIFSGGLYGITIPTDIAGWLP